MAQDIYLKQIQVGPMENFMYIIGDPATHEAAIVDPAWDVKRVIESARKDDYKVKSALVTHYHFDHTNGIEDFLKATDGVVYVNKYDAPYLKHVGAKDKDPLRKVEGGDKIQIGNIEITFLHTPGHTPGSQCFLVQNKLISGDTLFINACGRCDLPGGNAEQMYDSLKRLSKLDESTILLPGHNYADEKTSTIGQEKKNNPYMQFENMQNFLKHRMGV